MTAGMCTNVKQHCLKIPKCNELDIIGILISHAFWKLGVESCLPIPTQLYLIYSIIKIN